MSPDLIDAALRSLDPADPEVVVPPVPTYTAPRIRHRGRRRVSLYAAAVATVVAGAVAVPSLTGGGAAFASWRANPAVMPPGDRAAAAADCLGILRSLHGPGDRTVADELGHTSPVIAEARGDWKMVVLANQAGYSATCIGTGNSDDTFGGDNSPVEIGRPAPRQLIPDSLGTGNLAEGDVSVAIGRAGTDVVGVRYDSASHGPVEATVSDGWFALWVPGDDMEQQAPDNVPLTVTYRDGSSRAVALGFA